MNTPVIEIAKEGYDIKTCSDDQKAFSSEFNTLKVAKRAVTTGAGTYTHGLGYTPLFLVSNGKFSNSTTWGFVGQYSAPSMYEAPFFANKTVFYYWTLCKYFLFYQEVDT